MSKFFVEKLFGVGYCRLGISVAEHARELRNPRPASASILDIETLVEVFVWDFLTRKCESARAATCGRCVTQKILWRRQGARAACRTSAPISPPTFASTSSKTRIGVESASARTVFSASITRASSPLDAIFASRAKRCPGLPKTRIRTSSRSPATAREPARARCRGARF